MWRRPLEWNLNGTTDPRDGSVDYLSLNSLKDRHGPIRAPKSRFVTTMGRSAPDWPIGTFSLAGPPLVPFPLAWPTRVSSSVRKPRCESRLLNTGHRVVSK